RVRLERSPSTRLRLLDCHRLDVARTFDLAQLAVEKNLDERLLRDPVDQIPRHLLAELASANDQEDLVAARGEREGRLTGGVGAAHDHSGSAPCELFLDVWEGVGDADAFVTGEAGDVESAVLDTARHNHRARGASATVFEPEGVIPTVLAESDRPGRNCEMGTELLRLQKRTFGELPARQPAPEPQGVLH